MEISTITNTNEWWGYSQEHGWVVLDRNIEANQFGTSSQLLFVRCADWSVFKEKRKNWEKPKYISENIFITKLSFDEVKRTIKELTRLKSEYQSKRQSIHAQYSQEPRDIKAIIEKHNAFLELLGKKQGSYKPPGQIGQNRRITRCYSCKNHLDNVHDLECSKCKWIICENCGACGCGYYN